MTHKQNCWEFKKCGREFLGAKVDESGICPAANESRLKAVHEGVNAGRACWVVAGTLCAGKAQGTFAKENDSCTECAFYNTVWGEELRGFIPAGRLLKMLR